MALVNLDFRLVRYVQFMVRNPASNSLRNYVTVELGEGLDKDQIPTNYLFYKTFSRQMAVAPDGEILSGNMRDESDWKITLEETLKKN